MVALATASGRVTPPDQTPFVSVLCLPSTGIHSGAYVGPVGGMVDIEQQQQQQQPIRKPWCARQDHGTSTGIGDGISYSMLKTLETSNARAPL
jgi:hypothetical protein